jgi:2-polyprenyl-6-methoxyphenol hydroxylase-like FAD-dependent oxidoreductase
MKPESAHGKRTAIIVGGSTSGLMTAALLAKHGWDVRVYERSPVELVGRGAGIVCHDELLEALEECGAGTKELGVDVEERLAFADDGAIIGRRVFAQTVTSWDRLYQLVRRTLPDQHYFLDHQLVRVEQDGTRVRAHFRNGVMAEGDLLIGADGFRSIVRQHYLPDIQPVYAGYTIWRGLADEAALDPQIAQTVFERFTFHFPEGTEILGYPITSPNNDLRIGHRRYNWVWYRRTSAEELEQMLTDGTGRHHPLGIAPPLIRPEVIEGMRYAAKAVISPPLLHVLDQVKAPFFTPIYDLLSPTFTFGRVALVGDAAVVARPHVGFGTTKAAGDALSLARAIARQPDLPRALEAYSTERYAVGERCFHRGRQLGSWISGDKPRNQQEADEFDELHSVQGILRHVASGEFLAMGSSALRV